MTKKKHHIPTDETRNAVTTMAGYGVPLVQIAAILKINYETLKKYYQEEMETGRAKASFRIGQSLFQKAVNGDTSALMWWTKSQMGWKETKAHEITSPDGSMTPAIQNIAIIDAIRRKHSIEGYINGVDEENAIDGEYNGGNVIASDNANSGEHQDDQHQHQDDNLLFYEEEFEQGIEKNIEEEFEQEFNDKQPIEEEWNEDEFIDNPHTQDRNIVRYSNEKAVEYHQNKIIEDITSRSATIEKEDLEETYDYDDTLIKDISVLVDDDFLNHNFLNVDDI